MKIDKVIYTDKQYNPHRKFWSSFLDDFAEFYVFRKQDKPINISSIPSKEYIYRLSTKSFDVVEKLTSKDDSGLFIVVLSSISILLKRYSGNKNVIIDTPYLYTDGTFVPHKVPLLIEVDENDTLLTFLNKNQQQVKKTYEYQDYPLVLLNNSVDNFATNVAIRHAELHHNEGVDFNHDICITINNEGGTLSLKLTYKEEFFSEQIIRTFAKQIDKILSQFGAIETLLANIISLTDSDLARIISFNDTDKQYPNTTLIALFKKQVQERPENECIVYKEATMTFKEVDRRSDILAAKLTIAVNEPVAILLDYSPNCIIAILGIMKAGGVYVPIDPNLPVERICFILDDCECSIILTETFLYHEKEVRKLLKEKYNFLFLDQESLYEGESIKRKINRGLDFPVYILYTSGSTGNPKGVVIKNKAIVNNILWSASTYVNKETVSFGLYTSITFDITGTSIFTALITGNKLIVYPYKEGEFLIETVFTKNEIEVIKLTPSHLKLVKHLKLKDSVVKTIIVGGEKFDTSLAREIQLNFGKHINIYNIYGPTEATILVLFHKYNLVEDFGNSVPLGTPIDNVKVYILDKHLNHVPTGAKGVLYIAGVCLAEGYINCPDITEKIFIKSPFSDEILYCSGDVVRITFNNELEFIGRLDNQIKIRGHRIELEEIKSMLLAHKEVVDCIVTVEQMKISSHTSEAASDTKKIVAYFISTKPLLYNELRAFLAFNLPAHMIPTDFVQVAAFPLNKNGKVDFEKLKTFKRIKSGYVALCTPTEKKLGTIWKKLLGREKISVLEDFFEIGGHSILVTQMVHEIQATFNILILIRDVFSYSTLRELGEFIDSGEKEKKLLIKLGNIDESKQNIFFIPTIIGTSIGFKNLAKLLENKYNCFGLQQNGSDNDDNYDESIYNMALRFVTEIEKVQKSMVCTLVGYSFGVLVTYEITKILESKGYHVNLVFFEKDIDKQSDEEFFIDESLVEEQLKNEITWYRKLDKLQMNAIKSTLIYNLKLIREHVITGTVKSNIIVFEANDKSKKVMKEHWTQFTTGTIRHELLSGNHFEVLQVKNLPLIQQVLLTTLSN